MIAVVICFQQCKCIPIAHFLFVGKCLNFILHIVFQLCLRDSAQCRVFRHHGYVLEIVQLTENAELRKFVDSGNENEPQVWVKALYRAVEIPHYLPEDR